MIDFTPPPHVQQTVRDIHQFIADEITPIEPMIERPVTLAQHDVRRILALDLRLVMPKLICDLVTDLLGHESIARVIAPALGLELAPPRKTHAQQWLSKPTDRVPTTCERCSYTRPTVPPA